MPHLHFEAAIDRTETNKTVLSPIPDIVWKQSLESNLVNIHKDSKTEANKKYARIKAEK